jgi:hypothetical protein
MHAVRQFPQFGAETSVDEHDAAPGPDQEAADRQPGRVVAVEQLRACFRCQVAPEVSRPRDEGAVGDGMQVKVPDPHVVSPLQPRDREMLAASSHARQSAAAAASRVGELRSRDTSWRDPLARRRRPTAAGRRCDLYTHLPSWRASSSAAPHPGLPVGGPAPCGYSLAGPGPRLRNMNTAPGALGAYRHADRIGTPRNRDGRVGSAQADHQFWAFSALPRDRRRWAWAAIG